MTDGCASAIYSSPTVGAGLDFFAGVTFGAVKSSGASNESPGLTVTAIDGNTISYVPLYVKVAISLLMLESSG